MSTRVWIVAGPEWRTTVEALRAVDKELPRWLRDEMKDSIDGLVDEAQSRVESVGIVGGPHTGHTGLRARVAAGVGVRSGLGRNPYLRVYTQMANPSEAGIPRGLDSASGWRHPVFGNKSVWVREMPTRSGWFTDTFSDAQGKVENALERALEQAAEFIDRAS